MAGAALWAAVAASLLSAHQAMLYYVMSYDIVSYY